MRIIDKKHSPVNSENKQQNAENKNTTWEHGSIYPKLGAKNQFDSSEQSWLMSAHVFLRLVFYILTAQDVRPHIWTLFNNIPQSKRVFLDSNYVFMGYN